MKKFNLVTASIITSLFFLAACSSGGRVTESRCPHRDWYELGRSDGGRGATLDVLQKYRHECRDVFHSRMETLYTNGRNAGLVEYCAPENAFELGRMGLAYAFVCPTTMESEFLASYRKGQQSRVLQLKKKDLDAQIESITERLLRTTGGSREHFDLVSELDSLKKKRALNEREIESATR